MPLVNEGMASLIAGRSDRNPVLELDGVDADCVIELHAHAIAAWCSSIGLANSYVA